MEMVAENMDGIMCISHNRYSVLCGKSNKDTPNRLRIEFEENYKQSILQMITLQIEWKEGRLCEERRD